MSSPTIPPKNTGRPRGAEPIVIAVVCILFLDFLGFMGFRNLPAGYTSGGYVNMGAIVGEWRRPAAPGTSCFERTGRLA
jgi:hypothetical protein